MKNLFIKFSFTLVLLATSLSSNAADSDVAVPSSGGLNACGDSSGTIPSLTSGYGWNKHGGQLRCYTDIDSFKFTLYKAAICTSQPDTTNPISDWADKCAFIIDTTDGIELTLEENSVVAIPESSVNLRVLTPATYTHSVLIVGNEVHSKMAKQFTQSFRGKSGVGSYCYTINAAAPNNTPTNLNQLAVECVANSAAMTAAGDYDFSSRTLSSFRNSSGYFNTNIATNGDYLYALSDFNTLATVNSSNGTSDGTLVTGLIEMPTPVVINGDTSSIDLGFQLSDQGQIKFNGQTSSVCNPSSISATACVIVMHNYGVGFRVTAQ
jgi:hypothetical protein